MRDVVLRCKSALDSVGGDLIIKLDASSDLDTAKVVAQQMKRTVENADCKLPA
jgi:hypothetical protein